MQLSENNMVEVETEMTEPNRPAPFSHTPWLQLSHDSRLVLHAFRHIGKCVFRSN